MSTIEASDARKHCPRCGRRSSAVVDSIFVEHGQWTGDAYAFEGEVAVYRCADLAGAFEFADVTGFADDLAEPSGGPSPT